MSKVILGGYRRMYFMQADLPEPPMINLHITNQVHGGDHQRQSTMGLTTLLHCIPSGKLSTMENHIFFMRKLTISMVIFHSYVSHNHRVYPYYIPVLSHDHPYETILSHSIIPLNQHKIPLNHHKIPLNHYKQIPLNHNNIPLNHHECH